MNIFIQCLAIIALIFFVVSYLQSSRDRVLIWQIIGLLVLSFHFFLLNAWSGVTLSLVNLVVAILFSLKDRIKYFNNFLFLLLCLILTCGVFLLTWVNFFSLFALMGTLSGTLGKWKNKVGQMKLMFALAGIFFIIYDASVASYGGIIFESVLIIALASNFFINSHKHSHN